MATAALYYRTAGAAVTAAAAASSSSSATHHPHKGHLIKTEMHAEVQRLAIHASGAFLRWAKGMHGLATAATTRGGSNSNPKAKPPSKAAATDPSAMVPHEATLRLRVFSLVADRLEDWEDEDESTIGVSGSAGANAGRVARPHARYKMLAQDVVASSTAAVPTTGGVRGQRHQQQQQQQRPFFRQRTVSGGGVAGGPPAFTVPIPSSSDDEDAAADAGGGQRSSLLHTYVRGSCMCGSSGHPLSNLNLIQLTCRLGFRSGEATAQVRVVKPDAQEEAARAAVGGRQRFTYLLSEVQEPGETCFRFRLAGMQGESQQAVPLAAGAYCLVCVAGPTPVMGRMRGCRPPHLYLPSHSRTRPT